MDVEIWQNVDSTKLYFPTKDELARCRYSMVAS